MKDPAILTVRRRREFTVRIPALALALSESEREVLSGLEAKALADADSAPPEDVTKALTVTTPALTAWIAAATPQLERLGEPAPEGRGDAVLIELTVKFGGRVLAISLDKAFPRNRRFEIDRLKELAKLDPVEAVEEVRASESHIAAREAVLYDLRRNH